MAAIRTPKISLPRVSSKTIAKDIDRVLRRREQNRVNKAAQRARDAAGVAAAKPGPPRVHGPAPKRAQDTARIQRERRAAVLSELPDVRNPAVKLRVGEQTERFAPQKKTRAGQLRQAQAIRAQAAAQRLQGVGKSRQSQLRNELDFGPNAERLQEAMTPEQRHRFQVLSERIAKGAQQSTAILFDYAGGQSAYSSALERILASPESRDVEEGLAILAQLAETAGKANAMYRPKALGKRLTV